jgi:hypothetical protein
MSPSPETPRAVLRKRPLGRSPRPTIPVLAVHRNASSPGADRPRPTTTEPSAETLHASLLRAPPARSPSPTIPTAWVQRNASLPLSLSPAPTITEPSAETPCAELAVAPPARSPRPTMPSASDQRKASRPAADCDSPTTTEPSADTSHGRLKVVPPGSSPRVEKLERPTAGRAASAIAAMSTDRILATGELKSALDDLGSTFYARSNVKSSAVVPASAQQRQRTRRPARPAYNLTSDKIDYVK